MVRVGNRSSRKQKYLSDLYENMRGITTGEQADNFYYCG